jgi:hypothetical protein
LRTSCFQPPIISSHSTASLKTYIPYQCLPIPARRGRPPLPLHLCPRTTATRVRPTVDDGCRLEGSQARYLSLLSASFADSSFAAESARSFALASCLLPPTTLFESSTPDSRVIPRTSRAAFSRAGTLSRFVLTRAPFLTLTLCWVVVQGRLHRPILRREGR